MNIYSCKLGFSGLFLLLLGGCASQAANTNTNNFEPQEAPRSQSSSDPRYRAKIHTELGSVYFQGGSMSVALAELGTAIDADPSYFPAYSIRGLVYGALKENAKAESDFQRALGLAPSDSEVNNNYGWFLCNTGKEKESITYFLNALKSPLYQTPDRAYTNAGTCALKAGDLDNAQAYLLKALQMSRDGGKAARFQLARLFYMRGNFDESRVYFNETMNAIDSPSAELLWLGIRLERKMGNKVAENGYAAQLRSRHPGSSEYQEFLKGNFE